MSTDDSAGKTKTHRAGLFDIRIIIGLLIGIYGVILVITGIFTSDSQVAKGDGLNINLVGGGVMILASIFFIAWARIRPIIVPDDPDEIDKEDTPSAH